MQYANGVAILRIMYLPSISLFLQQWSMTGSFELTISLKLWNYEKLKAHVYTVWKELNRSIQEYLHPRNYCTVLQHTLHLKQPLILHLFMFCFTFRYIILLRPNLELNVCYKNFFFRETLTVVIFDLIYSCIVKDTCTFVLYLLFV